MVRELCALMGASFVHRYARALRRPSRCWRLPRTIFCDRAPAPRGPRRFYGFRRGGTGPAPGPSHWARIADAKCCRCLHRCGARIAARPARGARAATEDHCCEAAALRPRPRAGSYAATPAMQAAGACHAVLLAAFVTTIRPRPEGRQHLPDALSEESRRLRVPRGRHGSPLQRKDERREGQ